MCVQVYVCVRERESLRVLVLFCEVTVKGNFSLFKVQKSIQEPIKKPTRSLFLYKRLCRKCFYSIFSYFIVKCKYKRTLQKNLRIQ